MTNLTLNAEQIALALLAGELRIFLGKRCGSCVSKRRATILPPRRNRCCCGWIAMASQPFSALARAESVRPQSMCSTVAALQPMGAVIGVADPVDGRQKFITLTDAFRQHLLAHRTAKNDWLHGALETQLPAAEQAQLAVAERCCSGLPIIDSRPYPSGEILWPQRFWICIPR